MAPAGAAAAGYVMYFTQIIEIMVFIWEQYKGIL
jgi:hypothetical protein